MTTDTQAARRTGTQHTVLATRLGELTIVRDAGALTGLYFPHHWYRPSHGQFRAPHGQGFADVTRQLGEYLDGTRTEFDLPLDARGSDFQRASGS